MVFPLIRVQFAPSSTDPWTHPDECYFPSAASGEMITSGGTIAAWTGTTDVVLHVDFSVSALPATEQLLCYRYVTGSAGATDFRVLLRPDGKIRMTRNSVNFDSVRSLPPLQAHERITVRVAVNGDALFTTFGFSYSRTGMFGFVDGGADFISLGSQTGSGALPTVSGQVRLAATQHVTGVTTRTYGFRAATGTAAPFTNILGFGHGTGQLIPAGVTSVTDAYSAGTSWTTAPAASVVFAAWVTLSSDNLRRLRYETGRRDELAGPQATTASVSVDNQSRDLDPDYAAGPYFGLLVPRVPLRAQVDTTGLGSSWQTVWEGFAGEDGWSQKYYYPSYAQCDINAIDLLGLSADVPLPRDKFQVAVLDMQPLLYFPLDNLLPDTTVVNLGSFTSSSFADDVESGQTIVQYAAAGGAVKPASTTGKVRVVLPGTFPPITILGWMRCPPTGAVQMILRGFIPPSTVTHGLYVTPTGQLKFDRAGAGAYEAGTTDVDTDIPVFFCASAAAAGVPSFRLNGAAASTVTLVAGGITTAGGIDFNIGNNEVNTFPFGGFLDEICVYSTVLSPEELDGIYQAAVGSSTVNARYADFMKAAQIPYMRRAVIAAGTWEGSDVRGGAFPAMFLLDALAKLNNSEQGSITVDHRAVGGSKLSLRPRGWRDTPPASSVTITDADPLPGGAVRAVEIRTSPNSIETMINSVEVKWAGVSTVFSDMASVRRYGSRRRTVEADVTTVAAAKDVADTVMARYALPVSRVEAVVIDLGAQDGARAPIMALKPDDVITLSRQPLGIGTRTTTTYWVEGITVDFTPPFDLTVAIKLTPV